MDQGVAAPLQPKSGNRANTGAEVEATNDITAIIVFRLGPAVSIDPQQREP